MAPNKLLEGVCIREIRPPTMMCAQPQIIRNLFRRTRVYLLYNFRNSGLQNRKY